jgi:ABC-type sugar transport system permease subunit
MQKTRPLTKHSRRDAALAYALLAPALLLFLAFTVAPLVFGVHISLHNWKLGPRQFIGLANYARALGPDSELWPALRTTLAYTAMAVPLQVGLALVLAWLVFQKIRAKAFFRVALFVPWVTSTVATAAVWARLYSPDIGVFNAILKSIGLPPSQWLLEDRGIFALAAAALGASLPEWAAGPSMALTSVVVYTTWVFVGYSMTLFLAGLGNVPGELYEAARIDGATGPQLFRFITWPLLAPTTYFVVVITVIGTLKAFNHIWVMTQGAAGTETASILVYRQFYEFQRAGYASALAVLLSLAILGVTIVQNRIAAERVTYN